MMRELCLLLFAAFSCHLRYGAAVHRKGSLPYALRHVPQVDEKIVGGEEVEPYSIPYQVSMQFTGILPFHHGCGGSVMNELTIITAAHCCHRIEPHRIQIVAGEHDLYVDEGNEQVKQVKEVIMHEDYAPINTNNDMCLLILEEPLTFNEFVGPVSLPAQGQLFTGMAVVSGWGDLASGGSRPDQLQSVTVPIVSDENCLHFYPNALDPVTMICAGERGKDSCQGDSGGPLVCEGDLQCGVVSWGIGCAEEHPGIYAEVANFIDWINVNAADVTSTKI